MTSKTYRIGQIVPSSNTTMETEIPAMLNAHALAHGTRFTFHSSRMRMKTVKKDELAAMDAEFLTRKRVGNMHFHKGHADREESISDGD
jgi:maleate cis-trans isomerase